MGDPNAAVVLDGEGAINRAGNVAIPEAGAAILCDRPPGPLGMAAAA